MVLRFRRSGGMTLLEILTVIVILSLMLGLSVFFLKNANRDLGVNASANTVQSVLSGARQLARSNSAPSWVVLDTRQNSLYMLAKETAGEWHLEDATGAFGRDATITGGVPVPGRVGMGMRMTTNATIQCGPVPVYTPDEGVAIELWFLKRRATKGILASIGEKGEVVLTSEADGRVTGNVGALNVSSGKDGVPLDSWCHVQLLYSGRELRLYLNRAPVGVAVGPHAWIPGGKLTIGDSRQGLIGIVDEIRLSLIIPRDVFSLANETVFDFPAGFKIPPNGEVVIAFDHEGRLDPTAHASPFEFWVKSPAEKRHFLVTMSGTLAK
jgi:type II secretory pathway pseudopilin PulG